MMTSTTSKESNPRSVVKDEEGLNAGLVAATLSKALRTLETRSSTCSLDKWSTVELKRRPKIKFDFLEIERLERRVEFKNDLENGVIKREIVNLKVI